MSHFSQALRQLVLRPALSATVVAMLAVGAGATTAIYSLIHRVILETVPVPNADELVSLRSPGQKFGTIRGDLAVGGDPQRLFSYPVYLDLAAEQTVFTDVAAHYAFLASVETGEDSTALTNAVLVSGNYFDVLNLRPALGRFIDRQDTPYPDESLVAVLSYQYWQNRFGGDRGVIGETLMVNNQPLQIIGVAPDGFTGTMRGWTPLVYVPLTLRWLMQPEEPRNAENRQAYWLNLFARLRPGVSLEQAEVQVNALYRGILRDVEAPILTNITDEQKARYLEGAVELDPGARGQVYTRLELTNPLTLALGATVLVLLIACVNIANLLLARGASRAGEMAIRASLGASRWRLVAQLLTEATALAIVGAVLSIPVALATLQIVATMAGGALPAQPDMLLEESVLAFAGGITLGAVVVFGLVPALSTGRADTAGIMKAQSSQSVGGRGAARFRSSLVALQISLSLVLLVLAGLFTKSLVNVARIDYGMDVDSLVAFSVTPLLGGYSGDRLDALYERVREELAAQPGVESVAHVAFPIFYGFGITAGVTVAGSQGQIVNNIAQANPMVSPGFFDTVSIPLIAGRDFTDLDSTPEPSVVVVNESFVRAFGLGANAIGTTLRLQGRYVPHGAVEIVGVVGDAKYSSIKDDIRPQIFAPRPPGDTQFVALFYYVRAALDAGSVARMIPEVLERIDPNIPVSNLTTVRNFVDNNTRLDRLMSLLSATFAGLATALAAIGLYAVLAFSVAERKRELGLRLALGAEPRALRSLVFMQVARLAAIGGAMGFIGALAVGRVAQSLLFGLSAYDPYVLVAAVGALGIVVLGAGWLPAHRASSVAPMEALRYE
jgi:predicted permease